MTLSIKDIKAAAELINGHVVRTPTLAIPSLSRHLDMQVFAKLENLQTTGAFKVRGAMVKLSRLTEAEKSAGVVAVSAGNHAQGVAYHASRLGIPATIFMPEGTPFTKIGRTEDLGATVVLEGRSLTEAWAAAEQLVADRQLTFIHPFDDPDIIAGQGTVALELLQDQPDLDCLIVPIGGGGLIAGCAIAAKAINPKIKLFGVQSALYPAMAEVLAGKTPTTDAGATIAEGIAVKRPGMMTRKIIAEHVTDILLVDEIAIESAIQQCLEEMRMVVEGAGAAGLAALSTHSEMFRGQKVGVVVSGGNIDSRMLSSVLMRGLVRGGRLVSFRIKLTDSPGILAKVSGLIGNCGGNIVEVYHQRMFYDVPIKQADLDVVVETLDRDHVQEILTALEKAGFPSRILGARSLDVGQG
ncbi:MAG: threonine ammonia-lyase [Rhodospirillales bacterium]|nr:threonine ammonia-lyase [Rhodospirillales bacterium]